MGGRGVASRHGSRALRGAADELLGRFDEELRMGAPSHAAARRLLREATGGRTSGVLAAPLPCVVALSVLWVSKVYGDFQVTVREAAAIAGVGAGEVADAEDALARALLGGVAQLRVDASSLLGKGTFGRVRPASLRKGAEGEGAEGEGAEGEAVAAKEFESPRDEDGLRPHVLREIFAMRRMRDARHVARFLGVDVAPGGVRMVMRRESRSLHAHIHGFPIAPRVRASVHAQVARGLAELHAGGVVHMDLKTSNVLVTEAGDGGGLHACVCDLGEAAFWHHALSGRALSHKPGTQLCGTPPYRAPEIAYGAPTYSQAVDLWALGCVVYETCARRMLFGQFATSNLGVLLSISQRLGRPTPERWPGCDELLFHDESLPDFRPTGIHSDLATAKELDVARRLCTYDPSARPTAACVAEAFEAAGEADFDGLDGLDVGGPPVGAATELAVGGGA